MNDTPETTELPPIISLDDTYAGALIGHTVSPLRGPQYVYSLNALARIKSRQLNKSLEHVRVDVMAMVNEVQTRHGDEAPLFVDDAVSRPGIEKEKSRIIIPGRGRY